MTREQFEEYVVDFDSLVDFCNDYGYESYVEDVYDEGAYDEHIDEELDELVHNGERWWDVKDFLDDVDTGYDWYYRNEWGEWSPLTEDCDFDDWVSNLIDMLEDDGFFELDNEDEEELVEDFEAELESIKDRLAPIEEEDLSIDELFVGCATTLLSISQAREAGCITEI